MGYGNAKSEELRNELIQLQDEKHPWPFVHLGWFYCRRNQFDQALLAYDKAINLIEDAKSYYKFLSAIFFKKGLLFYRKFKQSQELNESVDFMNACEYFKKVAELDPKNEDVNVNWV